MMEEYFNTLLQETERRMAAAAAGMEGKETVATCREMVSYLKAKNRELKAYALARPFSGNEEEIRYFKYYKPALTGRLLYYYRVYQIESGCPGCLRVAETYYRRAMERAERMMERYLPFYQYYRKYSINSLVYWVTYVHNVVYSFYRSMIYCYINSTQRCAGSIVIDIIPTNGADKRKFFPFAPYFPVTNVIKRYFYPYFPAIIGIKGYSFPYFPYLSGIMKIKTALYSLFSRLDWHKTVVFPCLGEIYEGIRSLSWEIPVT